MNKIYITILMLTIFTGGYAQTRNEAPTTNLELPTYNIFNDSRYTIKAQALDRYVTEYTLMKDKNQQTKKSFILNPNTVEGFVVNFTRVFTELSDKDSAMATTINRVPGELSREATRLFNTFMISERAIETAEIGPEAGRICFEPSVTVSAENMTKTQMAKKKRRLKKLIRDYDLCVEQVYEPEDSVKLPCALEKFRGQKRVDWNNEIRQFWRDHKRDTVQKELASIQNSFFQKQRRIDELTVMSKADSNLLIHLTDTLHKVQQAAAVAKSNLAITNILIENDSLLIVKMLRQMPHAKTVNSLDLTDVEKFSVAMRTIRGKLTAQRDSIIGDLQRISVSLSDTANRENVRSLEENQAIAKTKLVKVEEQENILTELKNRHANLLSNQMLYGRQFRANQETSTGEQIITHAIENLQTRLAENSRRLNVEVIKKDSLCSNLKEWRKKQPVVNFKATNIFLDFNDGFIENIQVQGNLNFANDVGCPINAGTSLIKFSNDYPFGFSRKMDFHRYKDYELHAIDKNLNKYALPIRYLMPEYFETLETDRRDYSPKDDVLEVDFKTGAQCVKLQKDATFKLFEAKVYTDFVGLADDREPNGLVQTEIARRVFLNTYRRSIRDWTSTYGVLGYIEPEVTISKIENNNRRLLLDVKDRFENGQYVPLKYSTTLELRRYQSFTAGFDINVFSFDWALMKSTFFIDGGFRYGRTPIRDSIRTADENQNITREDFASDFGVNTTDIYPKLTWVIRSDERYCFSFSWSHHWYYLRDNRFTQVGNGPTFNVTGNQRLRTYNEYSQVGLYCTINTGNERGQIFARYHYFWQQGFWRTGFHQAQIGYSFYIFGVKPDKD